MRKLIALGLSCVLFFALVTSAAGQTGSKTKLASRPSSTRSLGMTIAAVSDDDVPGIVLPVSPVSGSLDWDFDTDDVFSIYLEAGQTLQASITGPAASDFDLYLFPPGSATVYLPTFVAGADGSSYPDQLTYTAASTGTYYLDAYAYDGSGSYTITYDAAPPTVTCDPLSVYTDSASFEASAADLGSGVKNLSYRLDSEATVTVNGAATAVSTVALGAHTLSVWAEDNIGNTSAALTRTFTVVDNTTLNLTRSSTTPAYGSRVTFTAHLSRNGQLTAIPGQVVVFERWSGSDWLAVRTASTDASGVAAVSLIPYGYVKTTYRARFAESSPYLTSTSPACVVTPKVRLTSSTSWSTLRVNKTYVAKGYIQARHATNDANKVRICAYKRGSNGKYRYVRSFIAGYSYYSSTKSRYTAGMRLPSKGKWKLVARHAADSKNAATYGSADYVTVK